MQEQYPESASPRGESVYSDVIKQQKSRRELEQQRVAAEKLERVKREADEARDSENCGMAIHNLVTLNKPCPVFYDGAGILRAACLMEGYYFYEGERTYVEDAERQELITFDSAVVEKCKD